MINHVLISCNTINPGLHTAEPMTGTADHEPLVHRWNAISLLRPAFSRQVTFLWFVLCCVGLSTRSDHLGVTSIVRALSLRGSYYDNLLDCCHSPAIKLPALTALWTRTAMSLFGDRVERVAERPVLIVDGKKTTKEGKKMPGMKSLHQESESKMRDSYCLLWVS